MVGTEFVHWNRTPQIMSPRKQHSAWCLAPSRCSVLSVCGLEILRCRWLLPYGLWSTGDWVGGKATVQDVSISVAPHSQANEHCPSALRFSFTDI